MGSPSGLPFSAYCVSSCSFHSSSRCTSSREKGPSLFSSGNLSRDALSLSASIRSRSDMTSDPMPMNHERHRGIMIEMGHDGAFLPQGQPAGGDGRPAPSSSKGHHRQALIACQAPVPGQDGRCEKGKDQQECKNDPSANDDHLLPRKGDGGGPGTRTPKGINPADFKSAALPVRLVLRNDGI